MVMNIVKVTSAGMQRSEWPCRQLMSTPMPPSPCEHSAWGGRFHIVQGSAPVMECHNDTIRPSYSSPGPNPDVPILDYGHTQSAGSFTCDSEPSGVTCTDNTTGHFFHVSRESYQLG